MLLSMAHECRQLAQPGHSPMVGAMSPGAARRAGRTLQSSICSESVRASSTSTPRYWTVLSILA